MKTRATAPDLPRPFDEALSRTSVTCITGMILEQVPPRLRSVACDPSTLGIRVLNQPLVSYQLALLRHHGVTPVVQTSLSGATLTMPDITGPILLLDGTLLTNADVSAMLRCHAERSPAATVMIAQHRPPPVDGGMCIVDARLLEALLSRPSRARPHGFLATLRAQGVPCVRWYSSAYSCGIHTPAAYHAAQMDLLRGRVSMPLDPPGRPVNGSWIGDDVTIGPDAVIVPPSVIGGGVDVGAGARVGPRAVVGSYSRLGSDVRVTESVVGEAVVVGRSAILDGCVVGGGARIGPFSILAPGAVLAGGTVLRSRTLLPRSE